MERIVVFLLALTLVMVFMLPAFAVEAENGAFQVDWTEVVVWLIGGIGTALSALLARVWMKYVKPWLDQKGLTDAAVIVVDAVEALMGRGGGTEKLQKALEKMQERGFNIDSQAVLDALKAAWLQLNLKQITAGVKEPEVYVPPDVGKEIE